MDDDLAPFREMLDKRFVIYNIVIDWLFRAKRPVAANDSTDHFCYNSSRTYVGTVALSKESPCL
jgi:hypothetical protein